MTYADNITKNNAKFNTFVKFGCRFDYSDESWTRVNPSAILNETIRDYVYYVDWTHDQPPGRIIVYLGIDGNNKRVYLPAKTYEDMLYLDVANPTEFDEELEREAFYYDAKSQRLYLNAQSTAGSLVPSRYNSIYIEKYYHLSTEDAGISLNPDDFDYQDVHWKGILTSISDFSYSVSDSFYGFMPAQSGSLSAKNHLGYFNSINEGSLSSCTIEVYRCVGELLEENFQLVFRGFTRDCSFTDEDFNLNFSDASILLDKDVFSDSVPDLSNMETDWKGKNIRQFMCGRARSLNGFIYSDYSAAAATGFNQNWYFSDSFLYPQYDAAYNNNERARPYVQITTLSASAGSNTTSRTYVEDVSLIATGDLLVVNENEEAASGFGHDVYKISAVGANYVDTQPALISPMGSNDHWIRSDVQAAYLYSKLDNTLTELLINNSVQHFSVRPFPTYEVILEDDFYTTHTEVDDPIDPANFRIIADIEGGLGAVLFPGESEPLNGLSLTTGYNENPVQAIYEILHSCGFYDIEKYYDSASFLSAASGCPDYRMSIMTPRVMDSYDPQNYRDVISKICETALLKVYLKNGKWHVDVVGPLGDSDYVIRTGEIIGSADYKVKTDDILRDIKVKYNFGEVSFANTINNDSWNSSNVTFDEVQELQEKEKQRTSELYLSESADADTARDRLSLLFSKPLSYLTINVPLRYAGIDLGSVVEIEPDENNPLPFTDNKKFSVLSIREGTDMITLELFDQRGIEDNSGDW